MTLPPVPGFIPRRVWDEVAIAGVSLIVWFVMLATWAMHA